MQLNPYLNFAGNAEEALNWMLNCELKNEN